MGPPGEALSATVYYEKAVIVRYLGGKLARATEAPPEIQWFDVVEGELRAGPRSACANCKTREGVKCEGVQLSYCSRGCRRAHKHRC